MQNEKNKGNTIEIINKSDKKIISNQLMLDFNLKSEDIIENKEIIALNYINNKDIFLISPSKLKLIKFLPSKEIKHFSILIGNINKKKQFNYQFETLELIKNFTNKKILVDSKGEQTTLYGRNVTKKMIKKSFSPLKSGKKNIIINEYDEVLGLGKSLINQNQFDETEEKKIVIKVLLDKGWYLRKGG